MATKRLPVGNSDFRTLREDDYYYVDKSLFIRDIMERGDTVILVPRPRRFGKTLNMTMLQYFFGCNLPASIVTGKRDTRQLFEDLAIWQAGEKYRAMQGRHPVIFLSFKDVKENSFAAAMEKIARIVAEFCAENDGILASRVLKDIDREYFGRLLARDVSQTDMEGSLRLMLRLLANHYGTRVILLVDEYDSPVHAAFQKGYYPEMIGFLRNFLSAGLKDTGQWLEKAVVTGILRVARESIFSGLNNLGVATILAESLSESFGFTDDEVIRLLAQMGRTGELDAIRSWYNGYRFGSHTIYNPWSIVNYLQNPADGLRPYWVNSSDNALVHQLLSRGGTELREELEALLQGEALLKPIDESIVFAALERDDRALWSFLLMGGYLKQEFAEHRDDLPWYRLTIPNREVRLVYTELVSSYFHQATEFRLVEEMLHYLKRGDVEAFGALFRRVVRSLFSYHDFGDESEKVYHAFTAGLLVWLSGDYRVKSNRESGYGRYDIMLIPCKASLPGYIIEFKKVGEGEDRGKAVAAALAQIRERHYAEELRELGTSPIHELAIVFEGKDVEVRQG